MVSAFIKFSQAKRAEILAANPGAGFGEVGKLLGAAWRGLSDAEKASYGGSATAGPIAKKNNNSKKNNNTAPEKEQKKPRKTRKNKGTHRIKKPVYGEEDIVAAPPGNNNTKKNKNKNNTRKVSPYAMFVKDHQAEVKAQNPGASFGDISRKIAAMWKAQK
jgi:hypothetical protein